MLRHILMLVLALVALVFAESWDERIREWKKVNKPKKLIFKLEGQDGPQSIKTYEEAVRLCENEGADIAENWRLRDAVGRKGYMKCNGCGWMKRSGSGNRYYYKNYRPICGNQEEKSGAFYIPCQDDPADQGHKGYDVYCYGFTGPEIPPDAVPINIGDQNSGYVFVVNYGNASTVIESRSAASNLCKASGTELATSFQVQLGYFNGMSTCLCGWMENYSAMPMRDSIPSCGGGSDGYIGCHFDHLKNVYCFLDARMEPRGANIVDFSRLQMNTYPNGIEDSATQIPGGYVYVTQHLNGKNGAPNIFKAYSTCKDQAAKVATKEQLEAARNRGMNACSCAWTWEKAELFAEVMVRGTGAVKKVCRSGIWSCPLENEMDEGYDIFCFKPCPHQCPPPDRWNIPLISAPLKGGRVFHYEYKKKYQIRTVGAARIYCRRMNAELATRDQLDDARRNGLTKCRCGFLEGGSVAFPIYRKIEGCGGDVGIFDCPGNYSDIPEKRPAWDAYCFISDEILSTNSLYDPQFAEETKPSTNDEKFTVVADGFHRGGKPETGYVSSGISLVKNHKIAMRKKAEEERKAARKG